MTGMRRHSHYPHHWPVHVAGMQALEWKGPGVCPAPASASGEPPSAAQRSDGELTAAPWLGLHYETDNS
jgi:hypothetical protein